MMNSRNVCNYAKTCSMSSRQCSRFLEKGKEFHRIRMLCVCLFFLLSIMSIKTYRARADVWKIGHNYFQNTSFYVDKTETYGSAPFSIVIENPGHNDAFLEQTFAVSRNSRYKFSAMVKCSGYSPENSSVVSGASIGIAGTYDHSSFVTENRWTKVEYFFDTKNETQVSLCLRNGMYAACCKGKASFCDVRLEKCTASKTNSWNILVLFFKNVDSVVDYKGSRFRFKAGMNDADVEYLRGILANLYTSVNSISGGLMTIKSIDTVSIDQTITKLGRYGNGAMIDPDQKEITDLINPYLNYKMYNQLIVISPIREISDEWAGLGGAICNGIPFCQINYTSGDPYPGNLAFFPDAIFVHEMLHCLERASKEINPARTPDLHNGGAYGYSGDDEWRAWYTAYMRAQLPGGMGLDPSVYQVYSDNSYSLISADMTVNGDIPVKSGSSASYVPNGTYTVGNLKYTVKNSKATVKTAVSKTVKKIIIPAAISIRSKSIKVTGIGNNAFKGMKQLTSLTIGFNVANVGKSACYKCTKLKSITVKTKKLTAGKTGTNAFKGIHKKPTVKCPKGYKSKYKKIFLGRGISRKTLFK